MSSKVHHETRTFACDPAVAIPKGARVRPNASGVLQLAGAADLEIGVTEIAVVPGNGQDSVAVRLKRNSHIFIASAPIAAFANFQGATNGRIATGGTLGMVFQAATAAGDRVEGMYY
jgi:hypothetical protein